MLKGQYDDPIARELQRRADLEREDVSSTIADFLERNIGDRRQSTLRLV